MIELRLSMPMDLSRSGIEQAIIDGAKHNIHWDYLVVKHHPDLQTTADKISETEYEIDKEPGASGKIPVCFMPDTTLNNEEWVMCFINQYKQIAELRSL